MSLQDGTRDVARRMSTRNPRRRQRHESDSLNQPRRKRSKIATDTYEAPAAADSVQNSSAGMNGHAELGRRKSTTPLDTLDMPLRGKKNAQKRAIKGDGSIVMTQNAHYSLKHLPSTPDIIRNSASDFRGSILSSPSYALTVTLEHAYVWDYTSPIPVAQPKVFDIPQSTKKSEVLPLGALVTNGASTSVGLLVVSPTSGKVTFWDNIDTAESLSLFQKSNAGVEGSLGSLFSGEVATDITGAEHAGFIITLSSGRIAQISVRDAQGKPKVTTQFLRSNDPLGGGGLFGSLKGVLGVGWKRDVAAVHTRSQGSRGQMQVISATANAQMQIWDLTWAGQSAYKGAVDFGDLILNEMVKYRAGVTKTSLKLLDFVVAPSRARGDEVGILGDEEPLDLVLLAKIDSHEAPVYVLIEVTLTGSEAYAERTIRLKNNLVSEGDHNARLILPKPGHTAHVMFDQKIVIVSLAAPQDGGPEAQLLMEAHTAPPTFQDAISLRADKHLAIQGSCEEESNDRGKPSASIIFIKGFGLARLVTNEQNASSKPRVSVKSRIEQAIFHGTSPDNVIDFSKQVTSEYAQEDVEESALAISKEILRSESPFISTSLPSIETQVGLRLKSMRALIAHIRHFYGPITRETCYKLLMDAEKLAVGLVLWQNYEEGLQNTAPKPTVLAAVIKVVRRHTRGIKVSVESEVDEIRHWFTYDLTHLDRLVYQALHLIKNGYESGQLPNLMKILSETDDIIFAVYETVFAYRAENAEAYGLDPTTLSDGILEEGWEGLPEPWTATHESLNLLDQCIDIARNYSIEFYDKPESQKGIDNIFVSKVVQESVQLVQILCRCYRERIGWCSAHYVEKFRNYAPGLVDKFKRSREHHLRGLMKVGQASAGTLVAEKYKDMDSLVMLVVSESSYLAEELSETRVDAAERAVIQSRMDDLQQKVERYFQIFGDAWATAFFDSHLTSYRSFGLLKDKDLYREPLTRFLRSEEARGRLGWINEILNEDNLEGAQQALTSVAREHENKLWNKKVELSISKLVALAVEEDQREKGNQIDAVKADRLAQDDELTVVAVQEEIYRHLHPVLYAAVDHDAEVQLVSDAYAVSIRRTLPALHQLLEIAFDDLLNHKVLPAEQLVDVLTLMDSVPTNDGDTDISGREFYLAFLALKAARSGMDDARFQTALKMVWKRCYLQDEWDSINNTKGKSDKTIQSTLRDTTLCQTMVFGLQDVLSDTQSGITILAPSEVIGAGSNPEDLQHRFPSDDLRDPIIHDNSTQDAQLQKLIDKARLQHWFEACREEAKKTIEEDAETKAADAKQLEELHQSIAKAASHKSVSYKGSRAHTNGGLKSHDEESAGDADGESQAGADRDDDGDMDMS